MLFNSYAFLLIFLPAVCAGYFVLLRYQYVNAALFWLILTSLFFYSFWNPIYVPLLLASLCANYGIANLLSHDAIPGKRVILFLGITANLLLLGYFKYANFFLENVTAVFGLAYDVQAVTLPLALSFITFQKIAYLVDSYRGLIKNNSFLHYSLFITFFPQLIAGPIVHHQEFTPQLVDQTNKSINYGNIAVGLFIISIGLCKKVLIADNLAVWANYGFGVGEPLLFFEAWATALAFTFQLYFDFSGYTDMAIGIALLFNIHLPINFNSPYKALNIQDFWQRWHITLSRFLRDYIYIPLGGNRVGEFRMQTNFMIVFLIGGLWHGASWTFVLWGVLHGVAMVIHSLWKRHVQLVIPTVMCWALTFTFIVSTWVLFRASTVHEALMIWKGMLGMNGISVSESLAPYFSQLDGVVQFNGFFTTLAPFYQWSVPTIFAVHLALLCSVLFLKNTRELSLSFKPSYLYFAWTFVGILTSLYFMSSVSEFIYFNF